MLFKGSSAETQIMRSAAKKIHDAFRNLDQDSLKPTLNSPTFNSLMNMIIGDVIEVITDVNAVFVELIDKGNEELLSS